MSPRARAPWLDAFFALVVIVMVAHESEHVAQMWQKDVRHATCPIECRGILGSTFDVEWVHAAYNHSILLALAALYLGYRMWRREWREPRWAWLSLTTGIFVVQGYHVVEHSVKLEQWLDNGHRSPTPGILGQKFSLIELHFTINTVVFVLVIAGYLGLGLHRRLRLDRPALAVVGTGVAALAVVGGVAWAARPPTVHLASGIHRGPLVLDHAQRLVGEDGAVVRGGIVVSADNVIVKNVAVRGGENGVEVRPGADSVLLDRVRIGGAELDGIHVRSASVGVRDCRIATRGEYGQGIDISFAMSRPMSIVRGCRVSGGGDGIVSHLANVQFVRNHVRGTSSQAIAVAEMSMGMVARNRVVDATGVGIACSDHSECHIERNVVNGVRPDHASGNAARMGYAIEAQYHAVAKLEDNHAGRLGAFNGARFETG